jgi:hypothetical protein
MYQDILMLPLLITTHVNVFVCHPFQSVFIFNHIHSYFLSLLFILASYSLTILLIPISATIYLNLLSKIWSFQIFVPSHLTTWLQFRLLHMHQRSRYSDWLQAGRPRGRTSGPGMVKNFHFSMSFRLALGSTQHRI